MLRLNIATQPIKVSITSQPARLELRPTAAKLAMQTTSAVVEIHQSRGQLSIDQSPCRASYGIKNWSEFSRDNAAAGKQAALEAVGRIAAEGDRLASIETGENAVAAIARDRMAYDWPEVVIAPIAPPEIYYEPRPPEFNPLPGKVTYSVQPGKVEGDYQPASVDLRVLQYPSIRMWTTEGTWDVLV